MRRNLLVVALASALATPALAQTPDSLHLDPTVGAVITGGSWKVGDRDGQYRIVVLTGGWEHITSRLFVQWLATVPDSQTVVVRATREVPLDPVWSLGIPRFTSHGAVHAFTISGTQSYTLETRRWTIRLGPPDSIHVRINSSARGT